MGMGGRYGTNGMGVRRKLLGWVGNKGWQRDGGREVKNQQKQISFGNVVMKCITLYVNFKHIHFKQIFPLEKIFEDLL